MGIGREELGGPGWLMWECPRWLFFASVQLPFTEHR